MTCRLSQPATKLQVAIELLDTALELYFRGDSYFAALHLAGATDELLGKYTEKHRGQPSLAAILDAAVHFSSCNDELQRKRLANLINGPKNSIKHFDDGTSVKIEFDPKLEAKRMLDRAMSNYYLVAHLTGDLSRGETSLMRRFDEELIYSTSHKI